MASVANGGRRGGEARAVLDLLGLAARARAVVAGVGSVRAEVRAGRVHFAIVAGDAAAGQTGKLLPLLAAAGVPHRTAFTRQELGHAIGRSPVTAVGIMNQQLAQRVGQLLAPRVGGDGVSLQDGIEGGS